MCTHAFITRACLIDPETNTLRCEITGPPVAVQSHSGTTISPGTVSLRVSSPDMPHETYIDMVFVVLEGVRGLKEGMIGNEHLVRLGVKDIHKYRTEDHRAMQLAIDTAEEEKDDEKKGTLKIKCEEVVKEEQH